MVSFVQNEWVLGMLRASQASRGQQRLFEDE